MTRDAWCHGGDEGAEERTPPTLARAVVTADASGVTIRQVRDDEAALEIEEGPHDWDDAFIAGTGDAAMTEWIGDQGLAECDGPGHEAAAVPPGDRRAAAGLTRRAARAECAPERPRDAHQCSVPFQRFRANATSTKSQSGAVSSTAPRARSSRLSGRPSRRSRGST